MNILNIYFFMHSYAFSFVNQGFKLMFVEVFLNVVIDDRPSVKIKNMI